MKKLSGTKAGTSPDTDQLHLSTTAKYLRERAFACRVAGGTSACKKLDAVAELLEPVTAEAPSEPPEPPKGRRKPREGSRRASPPDAPATLAERAATRRRRDLDDEAEEGDEHPLDDDGED